MASPPEVGEAPPPVDVLGVIARTLCCGWRRSSKPFCQEPDFGACIAMQQCSMRAMEVLAALEKEYAIIHRERGVTEEMILAGRDPLLYRDSRAPQSMLDQVPWYSRKEDGARRPDGYVAKGTCAIWVWRAMLAAAPRWTK